ncbi:hypothetical protein [Micromonospora avicenniae]|uniref:hypothetical protein n=1 Tax=Micromonospora avicenniae TaxID=1198245 RepID=UPI0011158FD4|nr:hypothetical protein [Micromonospora avicenniae]
MDSFWAGIVGALVGALVGGAFTAIASVVQVRGALTAARIQAEHAAASSRAGQVRELRLAVAYDAIEVNHHFYEILLPLFQEHKCEQDASIICERPLLSPAFQTALRRLQRFIDSRVALVPDDVAECLHELEECTSSLAVNDIQGLERFANDDSEGCLYKVVLDYACWSSESAGAKLAKFLKGQVEPVDVAEAAILTGLKVPMGRQQRSTATLPRR